MDCVLLVARQIQRTGLVKLNLSSQIHLGWVWIILYGILTHLQSLPCISIYACVLEMHSPYTATEKVKVA